MVESDEIRTARDVLKRERADVLDALAALRAEGARIADEQRAWRDAAAQLLDRGAAAELSVTEMARALGLSRQWTTHLRKRMLAKEKLSPLVFRASRFETGRDG
jgi:hypothetical protein